MRSRSHFRCVAIPTKQGIQALYGRKTSEGGSGGGGGGSGNGGPDKGSPRPAYPPKPAKPTEDPELCSDPKIDAMVCSTVRLFFGVWNGVQNILSNLT